MRFVCSSKVRYFHPKESVAFLKLGRFQQYHSSEKRGNMVKYSISKKMYSVLSDE